MKSYFKYIGPLLLCGLIIFLFINIRFERGLTLNLHQSNKIQALSTENTGAVRYLFYKHMFVNVITH
jgi:hypothetical protein